MQVKSGRIPLPDGCQNLTRPQKKEFNTLTKIAVETLGGNPTPAEIEEIKKSCLAKVLEDTKAKDVALKTLPPPPTSVPVNQPPPPLIVEEVVAVIQAASVEAEHKAILDAVIDLITGIKVSELDAENNPNSAHNVISEAKYVLNRVIADLSAAFSTKCTQLVRASITADDAERDALLPVSALAESKLSGDVKSVLAKLEKILELTPQKLSDDDKKKLERLTEPTSSMKEGENAPALEALKVSLKNLNIRNNNYHTCSLIRNLLAVCSAKLAHRKQEVSEGVFSKEIASTDRILRVNDMSDEIRNLAALMMETATTKELLEDIIKVHTELAANSSEHSQLMGDFFKAFKAQVSWLVLKQEELSKLAMVSIQKLQEAIEEEKSEEIDPQAAACLGKSTPLEEAYKARQQRIAVAKTQISTFEALLAHIEKRMSENPTTVPFIERSRGVLPLLEEFKAKVAV